MGTNIIQYTVLIENYLHLYDAVIFENKNSARHF